MDSLILYICGLLQAIGSVIAAVCLLKETQKKYPQLFSGSEHIPDEEINIDELKQSGIYHMAFSLICLTGASACFCIQNFSHFFTGTDDLCLLCLSAAELLCIIFSLTIMLKTKQVMKIVFRDFIH